MGMESIHEFPMEAATEEAIRNGTLVVGWVVTVDYMAGQQLMRYTVDCRLTKLLTLDVIANKLEKVEQ